MNRILLSLSRWWVLSLSNRNRLAIQIALSLIIGFSVFHGHFYIMTQLQNWQSKLFCTGIFSLVLFMKISQQSTIVMQDYFEFERVNIELREKNIQLEELQIKLEELSIKDSMTGAYNRVLLHDTIRQSSARAKRHQEDLYFLFFDIDKLKHINDVFGHNAGDAAITTITKIISEHVRSEDRLFRIGGDEFFLVIPVKPMTFNKEKKVNEAGTKKVTELTNRISNSVKSVRFFYEQKEIPLSISIGIHLFNEDNDISEEIAIADKKMYHAKNGK
ncbi:MAG: diguanylate cyclase [bacterium]